MRYGALVGALLVLASCGGEKRNVRIAVPLPAKLDLSNYDFLYMPGFITEYQHDTIDTEREVINFFKREFNRTGVMNISNAGPIDLSEKDPRSFFTRDQPFFKSFSSQQAHGLALTGVVSFESVDRSGFREVERTDYQGRRIRQTQFVEATGFNLGVRVYVYDINEGKLLYSELLRDSADIQGSNLDERLVLYDLMERVSGRVLSLFTNTLVKAERSLL